VQQYIQLHLYRPRTTRSSDAGYGLQQLLKLPATNGN
jgi:hypothetical protein